MYSKSILSKNETFFEEIRKYYTCRQKIRKCLFLFRIYKHTWREIHLKKIFAAILMSILLFTPVGNSVFLDQPTTVEAKSYKSGKRSFNTDSNKSNNSSNFQKKDNTTTNKSATTPTNKGFSTGGFMRGMLVGGLAGLLFGSMFANMGILGSILGLFINILGIVILFVIIRKIFSFFKDKKKREENPWRN
jgi:hypothetical protein